MKTKTDFKKLAKELRDKDNRRKIESIRAYVDPKPNCNEATKRIYADREYEQIADGWWRML